MSFFKGKNKKLLDAAKAGDETQVLKLLDDGAGVNAKDEYGVTPLRAASWKGHVAVVEALLARGADVNAKNKYGWTPLHEASYRGHVAVVEALIPRGGDVHAKDEYGMTPRDYAESEGHAEVVGVLDAARTSPNLVNNVDVVAADTDAHAAIFYEKIMALHQGGEGDAGERLGEIAALVEDPHMLKLFYMVVSSLRRAGILSQKEASNHIRSSLERSAEFCVCGYSIAMYKVSLKKAVEDGHLSEFDSYRLDNRAEVNKTEQAQFVKDIVASIEANTASIKGLEANVESINDSLNKIRNGIKRKMKVEGAVGMVSATLNIISFGAAGGFLSAGTAAFFEGVVDFGDVVHLKAVAADVEARFPDEKLVEQVDNGIELAAGTYADALLMQAVKEGNVLVVVSANAAVLNGPVLAHHPDTGGEEVAVETEGQCSSSTITVHSKLKEWLSTFLPEEDAAKYGDRLVEAGFDSVKAVRKYVREEDLHFMKEGHKRILMRKLSRSELWEWVSTFLPEGDLVQYVLVVVIIIMAIAWSRMGSTQSKQ